MAPTEDPNFAPFHYIGQALTPVEFRQYCLDYNFGSSPPSYWIWHHSYNPDASWAPVSSNQSTWWDRNEQGLDLAAKKAKRKPQLDAIARYYIGLGWSAGPHLFIDDLFIWLFTPMYNVGVHANEGNSYKRGGQLRYSIGCEVIGAYDKAVWPVPIRAMAGWAFACVKARLNIQSVYTATGQDRPDLHDPQLSGHRDYTTEKTCPGAAVTSDFFVRAAQDGWMAYQMNTPPYTHMYKASPYGAIAQQDRRPDAPAAKLYQPGEPFEGDGELSGYVHDRTGIGFVPLGQVVRL